MANKYLSSVTDANLTISDATVTDGTLTLAYPPSGTISAIHVKTNDPSYWVGDPINSGVQTGPNTWVTRPINPHPHMPNYVAPNFFENAGTRIIADEKALAKTITMNGIVCPVALAIIILELEKMAGSIRAIDKMFDFRPLYHPLPLTREQAFDMFCKWWESSKPELVEMINERTPRI